MEREFYSLADASGTIGCSVDDLIHYGASGHLNIIVLTTGLKGMLFDLKNQPVSGNIEIITDVTQPPLKKRIISGWKK